jgi:hypothetical protein
MKTILRVRTLFAVAVSIAIIFTSLFGIPAAPQSAEAAIDCSTIGYQVPSEVPANYGNCVFSVTKDFSSTTTSPDLLAAGYGRYRDQGNARWAMRRKLTIWKQGACDYAIRSEFIWAGVPNSVEGVDKSTPFKGRVTAKDSLRTTVTFYNQLGWQLTNRAGDTRGTSSNGVVLRGTGYENDYKDWDVSNPDADKPWSADWALAEWSRSDDYVPSRSKLELSWSLNFRESYDKRGPSDNAQFQPRWVSYGQTVVIAKKVSGRCDALIIATDYHRTVTTRNNVCLDPLKSSEGGATALLAALAFLPMTSGVAMVFNAGQWLVSAVEPTLDSSKSCPIRMNYGAKLTTTINP